VTERDDVARDAAIRAATVGELAPHDSSIHLEDYDPRWPDRYADEVARIRSALGERALLIEHVGSTSVPGLPAKPRIDIVLVVADSADEAAYVPDLEASSYALRIREPDWYEHRMLRATEGETNVHVFSPGCVEVERMLRFRDHLRTHDEDRALYERTKRELAGRSWRYVQHYADAKSAVIEAILERATGP
jgi:GrpB-like predicted nucleotidyltransferase (UPF0157 family)